MSLSDRRQRDRLFSRPWFATAVAACVAFSMLPASAATYTWKNSGTSTDFNSTLNWNTTAPVAGDYGVFAGAASVQPTLTASGTVAGLIFSGTNYTLSGPASTLTLTSTASGATAAALVFTGSYNTVSTNLFLNATSGTQFVQFTASTPNSGTAAILSGAISGGNANARLAIGGVNNSVARVLLLSNTGNSFDSRVVFNGSKTQITRLGAAGGNSSLGTNGTLEFAAGDGIAPVLEYLGAGETSDKNFMFSNAGVYGGQINTGATAGPLTLTGSFFSTATGAKTLTLNPLSAAGTITLTGLVSDGAAGSLGIYVGSQTGGYGVTLTNRANSFSGGVRVRGPNLSTAQFGMTGSNSILGTSGTINLGDASLATSNNTITYTGLGETSNKRFSVSAAANASIYTVAQNGEGTLTLSNTAAIIHGDLMTKTITLSGSGNGAFAGVIGNANNTGTANTGLTKSGGGTWTLTGANTFSGTTTINAGILRVGPGSLASSSTLSFGGGSLAALGGTLTVSNPLGLITTNGASFAGSESISVTGTLQVDGVRTITNLISGAGKKLTLGALTSNTTGVARTFNFDGPGSTDVGPLLNNTATGTLSFQVRSTGTVTLTAANTMTGASQVSFGTLVADFRTDNTAANKLGASFTFGGDATGNASNSGADLVLAGTANAPISVSGLRWNSSSSNWPMFSIRRQSSDTVIQVTGTFGRAGGSFVNADIEPGAVVLTTGTIVGNMASTGIIEGMTAGNDWATLSGVTSGTIQALAAYVAFPSPSTTLSATNYLLQGSGTNNAPGVNSGKPTLKILGTGNDQSLTITSTAKVQALLYAGGGNNNYSIVGGGTYGTGAQGHYFIVKTGTLTLATAGYNGGGSGAVKSGTGTLVWNTPLVTSTTGNIHVSQGVMRLTNSLGSGTSGVLNVYFAPAGAALELAGNVAIPAGKTHNIFGRGIADGGVIRSVSGTNSMGGAITVAGAAGVLMDARINADSGSRLTLTGGITTASKNDVVFGGAGNILVDTAAITGAGNLTKDGEGRLELKSANTYTGLTTVSAGELKVNGSIAASTAGVTNPFYVAAGATVSGTGTIGAQAYFDGTLAPGNSPGTITYTSDVVWSGSSTWNFELSGTASGSYDQVLITSGGSFYRDTGITGSDAAGYYKFDFLNTGVAGTFRLVDWSGTTNFVTSNFGYQNLASGLTGVFSVDNTESALFFTTTQSVVSANYALDVSASSQTIIQGGSTLITGTIRNTGPDSGDGIGYTGFSGTSAAGSFSLTPQSGTVASKTSTTGTGSFTTNTPGLYTITPAVASATNSTLGTSASLTSTGSVTVNVLGHTAPQLSIGSGGGQTIITGGTFSSITYTLSNPGSGVSPLQVGSLSNVSGATGAAAVASGSSGTYTATSPSNTTVASGDVVVSLQAGDDQSYSGASGLQTLGGTTSYTVLDHATPAFTTTLSSTLALNFGTVNIGDGVSPQTFFLTNLAALAGSELTASLDYLGTGADGSGFTLTGATFAALAAGGTSSQFSLSFTPTASGTYTQSYTLSFQDGGGLSGGTSRGPLTVTGTVIVVPEPATLALAAIGVLGVVRWVRRRRGA